jgi:hypothetical protein
MAQSIFTRKRTLLFSLGFATAMKFVIKDAAFTSLEIKVVQGKFKARIGTKAKPPEYKPSTV